MSSAVDTPKIVIDLPDQGSRVTVLLAKPVLDEIERVKWRSYGNQSWWVPGEYVSIEYDEGAANKTLRVKVEPFDSSGTILAIYADAEFASLKPDYLHSIQLGLATMLGCVATGVPAYLDGFYAMLRSGCYREIELGWALNAAARETMDLAVRELLNKGANQEWVMDPGRRLYVESVQRQMQLDSLQPAVVASGGVLRPRL